MDKSPAQLAAEQQQETPLYVCAECGETVIVYEGVAFRTCVCPDSKIVLTEEGVRRGSHGV